MLYNIYNKYLLGVLKMKTYIKPELERVTLKLSEDIAVGYQRVGVTDEGDYKVTTYQVDSFSEGSNNQ